MEMFVLCIFSSRCIVGDIHGDIPAKPSSCRKACAACRCSEAVCGGAAGAATTGAGVRLQCTHAVWYGLLIPKNGTRQSSSCR